MENILNAQFDKIFVINLAKRTDRWEHCKNQFKLLKNPTVERFEAYSDISDGQRINGNCGCTASHRALLEIIAYNKWSRVLILEDDFELRPDLPDSFENLFDRMMSEVPNEWNMLYLGGGYGEAPKRRVSKHIIETNAVMTTSSYAVTWRQARKMAPYVSGVGPIDSLYGNFNRDPGCFMVDPRLFVQYSSFSDLTERESANAMSMTDSAHEEMLLEGVWMPGRMLESKLYRRELSAPHDLDGTNVIVEGKRYTIVAVDLPDHPPSWYRGEKVTYQLAPIL